MPLTILSLAYPWAPVGPHAVGGAEVILSTLDHALTHMGHHSLVIASADSTPAGTLIPIPTPPGPLDHASEESTTLINQTIQTTLNKYPEINLLHCHGIDFHRYTLPTHVPVLVTLHMPPSWYPPHIFQDLPPNVTLQCVSRTQAGTCPVPTSVIPNGVPLGPSPSRIPPPEPFALALGRICPEKNLHAALQAGALAGLPVFLGGRVFPYTSHLNYFHQTLEPLLQPPHRFLGPLDPDTRRTLLEQASCLLLPTTAPETSSLVAMEALAAGTPVIAFPSGAIPEIVMHGETGFLVHSAPEMAQAISSLPALSRQTCRATAEARFSEDTMISRYLDLYSSLLGEHHA